MSRPCAVDGCPKAVEARGWCHKHYESWRRTGDPGPLGDGRRKLKRSCSIPGCQRRVLARGYCSGHYDRVRRTGDAGSADIRPAAHIGLCSVEGCTSDARRRGWCQKHYERWRRHGDPTMTLQPNPLGPGRSYMANGYIQVWCPGHPLAGRRDRALEHRMVLYDAGVDVPGGHHVHHINGDRADNRVENLEVLTPQEHSRIHGRETVVIRLTAENSALLSKLAEESGVRRTDLAKRFVEDAIAEREAI